MQAANNDGLWNIDGATLAFELRPHFYQTLWFYSLLLALTAGIASGAAAAAPATGGTASFAAVLGERGRIAREIHDTLAQGYVGVSAQLELLASCCARTKQRPRPSTWT